MDEEIEDLAEQLGFAAGQEIKSGVARPGDTIILAFNQRLTDYQSHQVQERVRALIPDVRVVIFPEVSDIRVFRPDGEGM